MGDEGQQAGDGTHWWFMSFIQPDGLGFVTARRSGTCTPYEGATRSEMFERLRAQVSEADPSLAGATVMFFDIQPDRL
ncbi:hypothetical protein [Streptomyces sp. SAI-127]|uniref:hypothetical protein n=1 Tax=Streptomyces sp. SAI-127 TaxID=2940543 RepID=UPI00247509A3|nr:hypothetical protein [Streptomyces sp. SAI-127]